MAHAVSEATPLPFSVQQQEDNAARQQEEKDIRETALLSLMTESPTRTPKRKRAMSVDLEMMRGMDVKGL